MSRVQKLRCLVNQRLTAAAEEIFGLFERTIAEYEEELWIHRGQDAETRRPETRRPETRRPETRRPETRRPETRRPGPGRRELVFPANLKKFRVVQVEVPPDQQDWSSSLDQEDPEPPHIKEDQDGEQLQGLEEAGIRFSFTTVKSEDEEEEAQSSHLHQRQTEHMETEADGEDCGGPEPDRKSDPHRPPGPDKTSPSSETENSDDGLKLSRGTGSGFNALRNSEVCDAADKPSSCSECEAPVGTDRLQNHRNRHTGDGTFTCQFCGKTFTKRSNLTRHLRVHTGEKPFACSVCTTRFSLRSTLVHHMRVHTGEKPFSCSVCSRRFSKKTNLTAHVVVHTEEKPFSCSVCDKRFTWSSQVKNHKCSNQSFGFQD